VGIEAVRLVELPEPPEDPQHGLPFPPDD